MLLVGCANTSGPFANKNRPGKVDEPLYNIEMQKQRAREGSSQPFDDVSITPNSYSGSYGPTNR